MARDDVQAMGVGVRQMPEQERPVGQRFAQLPQVQRRAVQGAVMVARQGRHVQVRMQLAPLRPGIPPPRLGHRAMQHIAHDP
ncbi:hypothetical protein G6F57_023076 [Rhizopus arrhizus]|uniref:Uncharacterized protein n=1 Tax=Rhizopus delemar TaxID=936053 RepID=A0A9P6XLT7_9FUNG|nr:hypothetical protein G6F31_018214 [Rhizopus arrhizus]KAG1167745.1 hypothetical protein G6F35_017633 [Rhizopus arrhizus]KAG1429902.1 hypothetical protein G6F57_023076 [Rhizopus arrhizus]KAG1523436.1 hypothetical protein G6F50_018609 [Rhizopus delemar]